VAICFFGSIGGGFGNGNHDGVAEVMLTVCPAEPPLKGIVTA